MIKIGTRKSKLALAQTQKVVDLIKINFPEIEIEIVPIITSGDIILDRNLYDVGGKALFLKEIENYLLSREIDLAVHSLKDVPGILPQDLEIAAVLERGNPQDVFISYQYKSIMDLPFQARLGSSSVRRKVLVHQQRPDIKIEIFRGNVQTRLDKLMRGEVDATILGAAGLERLNLLNHLYCHPLPISNFIPAIGQGVIAVEIRSDHKLAREICSTINHYDTWQLIQPERAFISYLDANCRTPMGAYSQYLNQDTIQTDFMLSNFEGTQIYTTSSVCDVTEGTKLGVMVAKKLSAMF